MKSKDIIISFLVIFFLTISPGFKHVKLSDSNMGISVQNAEMLYNHHPKTLSRDIVKPDKLSQDGRYVGYVIEGDVWIFDPIALTSSKIEESDELDWVQEFTWQGNSNAMKITGIKGGTMESKTVMLNGAKELGVEVPASFNEIKMGGNQTYAFNYWDQENDKGGLYLKTGDMETAALVLPDVYPFSFAFNADASLLAYLYAKTSDDLTLSVYNITDKVTREIATNLDGSEISKIGFAPNNQSILISLVSADQVEKQEKHKPFSDRDFDIFSVSIEDGAITPVLLEEGDDILVGIDGDKLYWNITKPLLKTVLVSTDEGKIFPLITEQAFMPSWHPNGNDMALAYGDWRMADYPLNWDIGHIKIDKGGKVTKTLEPLVEGYNQDFGVSWSPDGKWIAYQSRRTADPVMYYGVSEVHDGIYVKPAEGGDEIKIADFCQRAWTPDWSQDGKNLIFCASTKDSEQLIPWVVPFKDGKAGEAKALEIEGLKDDVFHAVYSPTEDLIALEVCDGSKTKSIWLVDGKGGNAKKLTSFDCLTVISGIDFTSDGKEILFSAYIGNNHQIHKIPIKGGDVERVTDNSYDLILPKMSPDGKWIATTIFRNTKQLWVADITM
jgi:WD40 repeat protein